MDDVEDIQEKKQSGSHKDEALKTEFFSVAGTRSGQIESCPPWNTLGGLFQSEHWGILS